MGLYVVYVFITIVISNCVGQNFQPNIWTIDTEPTNNVNVSGMTFFHTRSDADIGLWDSSSDKTQESSLNTYSNFFEDRKEDGGLKSFKNGQIQDVNQGLQMDFPLLNTAAVQTDQPILKSPTSLETNFGGILSKDSSSGRFDNTNNPNTSSMELSNFGIIQNNNQERSAKPGDNFMLTGNTDSLSQNQQENSLSKKKKGPSMEVAGSFVDHSNLPVFRVKSKFVDRSLLKLPVATTTTTEASPTTEQFKPSVDNVGKGSEKRTLNQINFHRVTTMKVQNNLMNNRDQTTPRIDPTPITTTPVIVTTPADRLKVDDLYPSVPFPIGEPNGSDNRVAQTVQDTSYSKTQPQQNSGENTMQFNRQTLKSSASGKNEQFPNGNFPQIDGQISNSNTNGINGPQSNNEIGQINEHLSHSNVHNTHINSQMPKTNILQGNIHNPNIDNPHTNLGQILNGNIQQANRQSLNSDTQRTNIQLSNGNIRQINGQISNGIAQQNKELLLNGNTQTANFPSVNGQWSNSKTPQIVNQMSNRNIQQTTSDDNIPQITGQLSISNNPQIIRQLRKDIVPQVLNGNAQQIDVQMDTNSIRQGNGHNGNVLGSNGILSNNINQQVNKQNINGIIQQTDRQTLIGNGNMQNGNFQVINGQSQNGRATIVNGQVPRDDFQQINIQTSNTNNQQWNGQIPNVNNQQINGLMQTENNKQTDEQMTNFNRRQASVQIQNSNFPQINGQVSNNNFPQLNIQQSNTNVQQPMNGQIRNGNIQQTSEQIFTNFNNRQVNGQMPNVNLPQTNLPMSNDNFLQNNGRMASTNILQGNGNMPIGNTPLINEQLSNVITQQNNGQQSNSQMANERMLRINVPQIDERIQSNNNQRNTEQIANFQQANGQIPRGNVPKINEQMQNANIPLIHDRLMNGNFPQINGQFPNPGIEQSNGHLPSGIIPQSNIQMPDKKSIQTDINFNNGNTIKDNQQNRFSSSNIPQHSAFPTNNQLNNQQSVGAPRSIDETNLNRDNVNFQGSSMQGFGSISDQNNRFPQFKLTNSQFSGENVLEQNTFVSGQNNQNANVPQVNGQQLGINFAKTVQQNLQNDMNTGQQSSNDWSVIQQRSNELQPTGNTRNQGINRVSNQLNTGLNQNTNMNMPNRFQSAANNFNPSVGAQLPVTNINSLRRPDGTLISNGINRIANTQNQRTLDRGQGTAPMKNGQFSQNQLMNNAQGRQFSQNQFVSPQNNPNMQQMQTFQNRFQTSNGRQFMNNPNGFMRGINMQDARNNLQMNQNMLMNRNGLLNRGVDPFLMNRMQTNFQMDNLGMFPGQRGIFR